MAAPAGSPQSGEFVQGSVVKVAKYLPMLRASSITFSGEDLTAIEIDAPKTFLSIGRDGRPTLAGMESISVTDESIVVVFDRSSEREMADSDTALAQETLSRWPRT